MEKKKILNADYSEVTEILKYISDKASSIVNEIYNTKITYNLKKDNSPLTIADTESNKLIMKYLKKSFKGIDLVSEESTNNNLTNKSEFFLIDPLDGTKEFIKRNGEFTVNIALVHNLRPVLGVINLPSRDLQYYTDGKFSFKKVGKSTKKINVKKNKTLSIAISRSHLDEKTLKFISSLKNVKKKPIGSSYKLCLIAEGMADLYVRYGNTMEWDIAAGHVILKNSGGNIFNSSLKELEYGKADFLNSSFIAFNYLENEKKNFFTLNL